MTTRNFEVIEQRLTAASVARALRILRREHRFAGDILDAGGLKRLCGHIRALSAWQRHRSVSRAACLSAVRSAAAINAELPIFLKLRDRAWARRWRAAFDLRDTALHERLITRGARPV